MKARHLKTYLMIVLAALFTSSALASYTAIVGKAASRTGAVLFYHNEDLGLDELQHIRSVPAQTHDLVTEPMKQMYWIEVPQVEHTAAYTGTFTYDPDSVPGALSGGMNEHGVAIGMNVGYPKEPIPDRTGMLWSDFIELVLERATTAREAVDILADLTVEYSNTDDPGQTFGLADPNEGWIFQASPTKWVAIRVPDDGWWVLANRYNIGEEWDLGSPDVIDFAIENGWFDPEAGVPFHFSNVYTIDKADRNHEWYANRPYDYLRELRSDELLQAARADGGITLEDVIRVSRDHYEGTMLEFVPPQLSPHRTIEVNRTVVGVAAELNSAYPVEIGATLWVSPSPPATTPYLPFPSFEADVFEGLGVGVAYEGIDDYDPASTWWRYNKARRIIETDWARYFPIADGLVSAFEATTFAQYRDAQAEALELWNAGDHDGAKTLLEVTSVSIASQAHDLGGLLLDWLDAGQD